MFIYNRLLFQTNTIGFCADTQSCFTFVCGHSHPIDLAQSVLSAQDKRKCALAKWMQMRCCRQPRWRNSFPADMCTFQNSTNKLQHFRKKTQFPVKMSTKSVAPFLGISRSKVETATRVKVELRVKIIKVCVMETWEVQTKGRAMRKKT